ncbi:MAG TPA: hypothetical protein PKA16_01170 [Ottowia sp.]|uniref:hypothetical protein n=1 Tax=Ottowia sp. TaxID=1898956 RepID=UPI002C2FB265|nr:hypothetical protein [Ottowia sp.]HMN19982.1 hypothetical protein [Ottowia sp.]
MSAMNRFQIASIAASAALLFSGSALAATPSAGMQPFFNDMPTATSNVQRASVRAIAAQDLPVAGQFADEGLQGASSTLTRDQVRALTRDAIAHGFHVASGESA